MRLIGAQGSECGVVLLVGGGGGGIETCGIFRVYCVGVVMASALVDA